MKINKGDVILDIPSKSIEDDTIGTIRYKEARERNLSKLQDHKSRGSCSYFKVIRVAIRHSLYPTIKVYGNGHTAGHHRPVISIKKQGKGTMSKSLKLKWR